jgi:transketolase
MSQLNQRIAYGEALVELGKRNGNVVALESDLGKSTMSCLFGEAFPNRYFEMGIAESNMTSVAAGLSLTGKIPFVHSFAVFAAGRAYDQIRQSIAIPGLNVNICGSSSGLSDFGDGSTHQAVEDTAIMQAIPNMTVLGPADAVETRHMVFAMADIPGPCYIRISRNDLPIYTKDEAFVPGKMNVLRPGTDAAIFANGVMLSKALAAAEILAEDGISVKVINASTVKPMDPCHAAELVSDVKAVVTAEEHSVIGGLGAAVSRALQGRVNLPVAYVGIQDSFGTSAYSFDELLVHYGLTEKEIVSAVRKGLALV